MRRAFLKGLALGSVAWRDALAAEAPGEKTRYLQARVLHVVQADPEWCGGVSELVRIATLEV